MGGGKGCCVSRETLDNLDASTAGSIFDSLTALIERVPLHQTTPSYCDAASIRRREDWTRITPATPRVVDKVPSGHNC